MSTTESTHSTPFTRAEDAAKAFMSAVNEMSFDTLRFAEVVATDHRTLQQSATAVLLSTILQLAENNTDDRNEAAVTVCRQIKDFLTDQTDLFIDSRGVVRFPFI